MQTYGQSDGSFERQQLICAVVELGYPQEFGALLARELGGPWSMTRMTEYLRGTRPQSLELIADELVSILDQRKALSDKIESERANAGWNEFLNRDDREEDD